LYLSFFSLSVLLLRSCNRLEVVVVAGAGEQAAVGEGEEAAAETAAVDEAAGLPEDEAVADEEDVDRPPKRHPPTQLSYD
jgi:hypothetical protein